MQREIKFDLIYKGDTRFHHKKYHLSELMCGIRNICDIHHMMNLVATRQFTGLKDKNGVEIYEGDLLNIFFTSGDGEYIHDCVYRAQIGGLGDVQFNFVDLLWSCHGHNQYPSSTTLCSKYESLDYEYGADEIKLKVPDSWGENRLHGNRWKQNDKSFYFEVIGNIYENPELLGETK